MIAISSCEGSVAASQMALAVLKTVFDVGVKASDTELTAEIKRLYDTHVFLRQELPETTHGSLPLNEWRRRLRLAVALRTSERSLWKLGLTVAMSKTGVTGNITKLLERLFEIAPVDRTACLVELGTVLVTSVRSPMDHTYDTTVLTVGTVVFRGILHDDGNIARQLQATDRHVIDLWRYLLHVAHVGVVVGVDPIIILELRGAAKNKATPRLQLSTFTEFMAGRRVCKWRRYPTSLCHFDNLELITRTVATGTNPIRPYNLLQAMCESVVYEHLFRDPRAIHTQATALIAHIVNLPQPNRSAAFTALHVLGIFVDGHGVKYDTTIFTFLAKEDYAHREYPKCDEGLIIGVEAKKPPLIDHLILPDQDDGALVWLDSEYDDSGGFSSWERYQVPLNPMDWFDDTTGWMSYGPNHETISYLVNVLGLKIPRRSGTRSATNTHLVAGLQSALPKRFQDLKIIVAEHAKMCVSKAPQDEKEQKRQFYQNLPDVLIDRHLGRLMVRLDDTDAKLITAYVGICERLSVCQRQSHVVLDVPDRKLALASNYDPKTIDHWGLHFTNQFEPHYLLVQREVRRRLLISPTCARLTPHVAFEIWRQPELLPRVVERVMSTLRVDGFYFDITNARFVNLVDWSKLSDLFNKKLVMAFDTDLMVVQAARYRGENKSVAQNLGIKNPLSQLETWRTLALSYVSKTYPAATMPESVALWKAATRSQSAALTAVDAVCTIIDEHKLAGTELLTFLHTCGEMWPETGHQRNLVLNDQRLAWAGCVKESPWLWAHVLKRYKLESAPTLALMSVPGLRPPPAFGVQVLPQLPGPMLLKSVSRLDVKHTQGKGDIELMLPREIEAHEHTTTPSASVSRSGSGAPSRGRADTPIGLAMKVADTPVSVVSVTSASSAGTASSSRAGADEELVRGIALARSYHLKPATVIDYIESFPLTQYLDVDTSTWVEPEIGAKQPCTHKELMICSTKLDAKAFEELVVSFTTLRDTTKDTRSPIEREIDALFVENTLRRDDLKPGARSDLFDEAKGRCYCCGTAIKRASFEPVYAIPEQNDSLVACCPKCKLTAGQANLFEFMLETKKDVDPNEPNVKYVKSVRSHAALVVKLVPSLGILASFKDKVYTYLTDYKRYSLDARARLCDFITTHVA